MHTRIQSNLLLVVLLHGIASAAFAASAIGTRLNDPKAVYLDAPEFGARADGKSDDSAALQAAIDKAENNVREGIVFVPSGQYRVTRTLYVWPGVRVIGYGVTQARVRARGQHAGFSERYRRDGHVHRRACGPWIGSALPRAVFPTRQRAAE